MARVLIAVPTVSTRFLGGLEFSVLLFTDRFVAYLRSAKTLGKLSSLLSPLGTSLSLLAFGLSGKAREFMESLEKLKGTEIREEYLRELHAGKGSYTAGYSEIRRIKVSKTWRILIEIHT